MKLPHGARRVTRDLVSYGGFIWTRGNARKAAKCYLSSRRIDVGQAAYRPITNKGERMLRVAASVWDGED